MALNSREKLLTVGVGAIATLFVGRYLVTSVQDGFEKKKNEIASLQKKKSEQELQMTAIQVANQKLNKIVHRSLPKSEEFATGAYSEWLNTLGKEANLSSPTQSYSGEVEEKGGSYHLYKFSLYGTGTLENALQLQYGFYLKDYLHRITRFDLTPIPNSPVPNQLNISLECEVLSLAIAKEKQEPPKAASNRIVKSLEEYKRTILDRNLFSAKNQPPKLDAKHTVEAKVGSPLDYTVQAKELDPNQTVSYELRGDKGEIPKGLLIDKNSGKMTFRSNEIREYKVVVQASDNGIPSKSSEQLVTIKVTPSPPVPLPPVEFNIASQAEVTALIVGRSGPEAWIRSKTESKTYVLHKGDQLKLGGVTGTVKEVGANYVELETDGRKWLVGLDESLADAYSRGTTD